MYEINILTIKPRAFILVGRSNVWDEAKKEAFRKLNYALHGIEVLTYDDLEMRANQLIKMYSKSLD